MLAKVLADASPWRKRQARLTADSRHSVKDFSQIRRQLLTYKQLYSNMPTVETVFELSSSAAFEYCLTRPYFVLVCPYTPDKRVLVERTFTDTDIRWSLLGGSLSRARHEDFIAAADRLAQYNLQGIELADIEPVAFLTNKFHFKGQECTHEGLAFAARIRTNDVAEAILASERTRGHLVSHQIPIDEIELAHNGRVFKVIQSYLDAKGDAVVPFHDFEVAENIKYRNRYRIHNGTMKPAIKWASQWARYPFSIKELNARIDELVAGDGIDSLIDVACGENSMCEDLARDGGVTTVVGNDVSWSQIELMQTAKKTSRHVLLYTNHDATTMPFPDKTFDAAICKNVLHHMPDRSAVERLVRETSRIARRAVIVEVMDPADESMWGRVRHRWYMDFLKDAAVHFYSTEEFYQVTDVPGVRRFSMPTIRGVYNFAVIET